MIIIAKTTIIITFAITIIAIIIIIIPQRTRLYNRMQVIVLKKN